MLKMGKQWIPALQELIDDELVLMDQSETTISKNVATSSMASTVGGYRGPRSIPWTALTPCS